MKILEILVMAISAFGNQRALVRAQQARISELEEALRGSAMQVQTLNEQHAADELDDAALEEAAEQLQERLNEELEKGRALQAELEELNQKAAELQLAINEHPETPVVDGDFQPLPENVPVPGDPLPEVPLPPEPIAPPDNSAGEAPAAEASSPAATSGPSGEPTLSEGSAEPLSNN